MPQQLRAKSKTRPQSPLKSFKLKRKPMKVTKSVSRLKHARKGHFKRKKRQTGADLKRTWGVHPKAWMRYTGIKGIYWHYFSRHIRERDYEEHGGLCMTCNQFVENGQDQCGHFFPARNCGIDLLFHPLNNHLQHSKCNNPRFSPHAGIYNTSNLLQRYGRDIVEKLEAIKVRKNQKEWSKQEYADHIKLLPTYYQ